MKSWLLYFLSVTVALTAMPIGARVIFREEKIPRLTVFSNGEITEMDTEEFALRVLVAQSEKCKDSETRKALAVAARSCGLYLSLYGCKHDDFDACQSGNCCFDLGDLEQCDAETLALCQSAAESTFGIALTVEGLPAMALFSDCLGSGSVNCDEFKYLTAVSEEERCATHVKEKEIAFNQLPLFFGDKENSCLVYGENQKVDFGVFGGKYIEGKEISATLSLNSDEFLIEYNDNGAKVKSFGEGNGFGMSICGAEAKARDGMEFEEILEFYYPNLILNKIYHN